LTTAEFVPAAFLKATGQVFTGTSGDEDWVKMLAIGNFCIDLFRDEPGVDWDSTYDPGVDIGTVTATDTFDLDDSIYKLSKQPDDSVQITHTDSQISNYSIVKANQLKRFPDGKYCAKVGATLKFNKAFTSADPEFGGTITVPCHVAPEHLVSDSDDVPVDNPNWLVLMSAAEWVQSDITLAQNYPGILTQANEAMTAMKAANAPQFETIDRSPVARGTEW
jgi:hypothetical protein